MTEDFMDLTPDNLAGEHLCCIIRKKSHPGVDAKRMWLADRQSGRRYGGGKVAPGMTCRPGKRPTVFLSPRQGKPAVRFFIPLETLQQI